MVQPCPLSPKHRHAWTVIPALGLWAVGTVAFAQGVPARAAVPSGEPSVRRIVLEDEHTRIEELRVGGQTERVVVRSKQSALPAWEIRPDSPGRTGAADSRLPRENASTRQWAVFRF